LKHIKFLAATLLVLTSFTVLNYAVASLASDRRLIGHGSVAMYSLELSIYYDSEFSKKCTHIDWGELSPGETGSQILYARNEGDYPSTLTMYTNNWQPSAVQSYLTLRWNATSTILQVNQSICILFWLQLNPQVQNVAEFSFNIYIVSSK